MSDENKRTPSQSTDGATPQQHIIYGQAPKPLPNYTLSTVCPACNHETFRLACKVRCARCGFMWDCSEL